MALSLATAAASLETMACSGQLDGDMGREDTATSEQAAFAWSLGVFVPGKDLDGTPLRICNANWNGGPGAFILERSDTRPTPADLPGVPAHSRVQSIAWLT